MCENSKGADGAVRPIRAFGNWIDGCIDATACNYNPEANMDDGSSQYAQDGFDCYGNELDLNLGEFYQGGYIFYLDESGDHGFIAAPQDLEGTYEWGCYGEPFSGANGWDLGDGLQNTLEIVARCPSVPIAASVALSYEEGGFTDWYLPSKIELEEMSSISSNGSFDLSGNYFYWSSTEGGANVSWSHEFVGNIPFNIPNSSLQKVRPIRSF